jgi:hypothetical protein
MAAQQAVLRRRSCHDAGLFEVGRYLVEAGLYAGFILVAIRGTGNADGPNGFFCDHDRQRTLRRGDVGQAERARRWIVLDVFGKFASGNPLDARCVGFLHGVFKGVSAVASEMSLRVRSWAFVELVTQPNAVARESAAS